MTRTMCVRLTSWPIDRAKRRRPELRHDPLALVETTGTRQTVSAACDRAAACGVRRGMALAEARALCSNLVHAPFEPEQDRRALSGLGRWLVRYSPAVAPAPPDALFVDVTGCERLYGGLDVLLRRVADAMAALRIRAQLAIAPNPGAAWAVAAAGGAAGGAAAGAAARVIEPDDLAAALAPLPPGALRLDAATSATLDQLGIATIGQLAALPRAALPARFGAELLRRLDLAFGRIAEPLAPLGPRGVIRAKVEFEGIVESLETLWGALREAVGQVAEQLARGGLGAGQLWAEFHRAHAPPIGQGVRLCRPSRDPAVLFNLLRCASERIKSTEGFTAIRLAARGCERLGDAQRLLLEQEEQAAGDELDRLVELLCARLGPRSLLHPVAASSHLPERAFRLTESHEGALGETPGEVAVMSAGARPLCLLPQPVEVAAMVSPSQEGGGGLPLSFTRGREVHRLVHADGPERIAGLWWEGRRKTRDYFDVEDEAGRRFWLFRVAQTGKWYLHGVFD